ALVIEMADDAGDGVLVIGEHGAAVEAGGINAMMTGRGDVLLERRAPVGRGELADAAPGFVLVETVERVTRGHARLAPGTFVEVHLEGVLLTGRGRGEREQIAIARGGDRVGVVRAGKSFHRREFALLGEQFVNERARLAGVRFVGRLPRWKAVAHRVSNRRGIEDWRDR